MRRGSILTMLVIGAVTFVAVGAVAVFIPWLPEAAASERDGIDLTFWLATWICIGVFAVVVAVTVYSVWKFRARPDDDSDGPPIHGHTGLEIGWTAVPFALVVVLGIVSALVLADLDEASGENANRVEVTAQQFAWSFRHPNDVVSGVLRVPVGRSTVLELTALDVIHSFWVPQFGQKKDAVPGITTRLVITPTKVGSYPVICTELCGLGHSVMRSRVEVMSEADYGRWLEEGGEQAASGEAIFADAGCGGCHAFEPAGSTAELGPPLDDLTGGADFVRESIVDPDARVAEGYSADVMPENYEQQLSDEQLDALVQYLVEGAAG